MATTIRIRVGHVEVEVSGEEEFVINRLPNLLSDLICRIETGCGPATTPTPTPPATTPSADPRLASIAGDVRDYFTGEPVTGAQVTTDGLTPDLTSRSDNLGRFVMAGRSAGDRCLLIVSAPDVYLDTVAPVELSSGPTTLSAVAIARADISRQHASLGSALEPETSTIIIDLLDSSGAPLEMVPVTDITLTTTTGLPVGSGPYFFGATGDLQPQADMPISRAFDKRARAAFLNVPEGNHTIQVTAAGTGDSLTRATVGVRAARGATVIQVKLPG